MYITADKNNTGINVSRGKTCQHPQGTTHYVRTCLRHCRAGRTLCRPVKVPAIDVPGHPRGPHPSVRGGESSEQSHVQCMHAYMQARLCTLASSKYTYVDMYTYDVTYIYPNMHTHIQIHTQMYRCTCIHMCTYVYTCIYKYVYRCICMYTCIFI